MKRHIMSPESFCFALLVLLSAFIACAVSGCGTGQSTRFEQRRVVGITSASIGEYTIPVISIGEGPSATVWQSKTCGSFVELEGHATTTNRTSALGIYESHEQKAFDFKGRFKVGATNAVPGAAGSPDAN